MYNKRFCFIFLGIFLLAFAVSSQANELYTVSHISVDQKGQNATAARKKAIKQAQEQAFHIMLGRIIAPNQLANVPNYSIEHIASAVQSLSITDEKITNKRYRASFTISFNPEYVRTMLRKAHIAFDEQQTETILVVPLLYSNDTPLLWNSKSPWHIAWNNAMLDKGQLKYLLPLGDLEDINAVSLDNLIDPQYPPLAALAQRYGTHNIVVATARYNPDDVVFGTFLTITFQHLTEHSAFPIQRTNFLLDANSNILQTFEEAAAYVIDQTTLTYYNQKQQAKAAYTTLSIQVPFKHLHEWVAIESILNEAAFIEQLSIKELANRHVTLSVRYKNSDILIDSLFKEKGLLLYQKNGTYTLSTIKG